MPKRGATDRQVLALRRRLFDQDSRRRRASGLKRIATDRELAKRHVVDNSSGARVLVHRDGTQASVLPGPQLDGVTNLSFRKHRPFVFFEHSFVEADDVRFR